MIGQLDQRVTFQAVTRTPDGMGGTTEVWADLPSVPTVWAQVKVKRGKEEDQAGRVVAVQRHEFTVRNRSDVSEGDRIIWSGDVFNIREVANEGSRSMYLRIYAERGVA